MSSVDEMYMESLEEWVFEENKVITYKYLSRVLKCHVNVAKQMLFNFAEENKKKDGVDLGVVYLLSGTIKSELEVPKLKVCLVKGENLEKESAAFENILSTHVYSVQKTTAVTATALYASDLELSRDPSFEASSINAHNAIKNKAAVPRKVSQASVAKPKTEPIKKEAIKKDAEVAKKEPEKKNDSSDALTKVKPIPKGQPAAGKGKAGGGGNIASMFAKQAAKPKKEKAEEKKPELNTDLGSSTSPGKENLENQQLEQEKEKKEKSVEKSKKPAPKTAKSSGSKKCGKSDTKKRKRITIASDSESEEGEDEEGDERREEEVDDEVAPPQARLIQSDEEEEEEEEVIPSTPQPEQGSRAGKRRVKKTVDKTYQDEKGFIVTKKEDVYVTDDEVEEEEEQRAEPIKKIPAKIEPPAAKKQKVMATTGTKQTGIMAFFKKK